MASSLAATIKEKYGFESELIRSGGGVFEVEVDGKLVFSKKAEGRFPRDEEVFAHLETP